MSDGKKLSVTRSTVKGDVVQGDKTTYNFEIDLHPSIHLNELYAKFQMEKEENPELKEFCDELNYYMSEPDGGEVKGVELKLDQAGRQRFINYAVRCKDRFHRKLMMTSQFSIVAQEVNIYLLALVETSFMNNVYTMLCNGESDDAVDTMIQQTIVEPVLHKLGKNPLMYDASHVMGMLYFLTGNCHLNWNEE